MSCYSLFSAAASGDQWNWLYGQLCKKIGSFNLHNRASAKCVEENRRIEISCADTDLRFMICDAVSEYVIDFMESGWVRHWIAREYHFNQAEEIDGIEKYYRHESDPTRKQRKKTLEQAVLTCLAPGSLFNLDGFIRFRLNGYRNALREFVESAIDEHLLEKQYQEFISLLKYFIYLQEAKIPLAHLIHKGGHQFVLLDEHMKPIETEKIEIDYRGDITHDFHSEDIIVSTLITISPQRIHIHTRNPELQVIQTIRQVFENRTTLCTHCPTCTRIYGVKKRIRHVRQTLDH